MRSFISFDSKNVIDFGCNAGGMLFHLLEIDKGIGFDYDEKCIEAANSIKDILKTNKVSFLKFDLDKDNYTKLKEYITFKPDIILLLSIGSWISNIEKLFDLCIDYGSKVILESNNKETEDHFLSYFSKAGYTYILISDKSDDDILKTNYGRKTYLLNR